MSSRWLAVLIIPLGSALGGCDAEQPPDEPRPDVRDAPGSITPDFDREPQPRLRTDTVPEAAPDTGPGVERP